MTTRQSSELTSPGLFPTVGADHQQPTRYTSPKPEPAAGHDSPARQPTFDAHHQSVGGGYDGGNGSPVTIAASAPKQPPWLADPFLALAADVLDDAERNRIANENRLRQLTRSTADSDGVERGFGLDESHPDVARLAAIVDMLAAVEHQATLNLQRQLRAHPLGPWCKAQRGIGDKQAARLLAAIGDPYWHPAADRPRLVSELWSYCGHGDPRRRPRKGATQADLFACGNPVAKMRTHLVAESVMKAGGPWRAVYDDRRTVTETRLHVEPCVRCGPSGHPAQPGTPWSLGHQHHDALRITGKAILRGLWLEARRLHETRGQVAA